ncbi:replication factor A protein, partial [Trifolium medium]|nr:replication factor A protein [Trifolium medium]
AENAGCYPSELLALVGSKLLFKVEKVTSPGVLFDGSFRVKRMCNDPSILESFGLIYCQSPLLPSIEEFISGLLVSPDGCAGGQICLIANTSSAAKRNLVSAFDDSVAADVNAPAKAVKLG